MAAAAGGSGALILAAEQVNICPCWQETAVRAVVGVEEGEAGGGGGRGGGGVWLQMLQHTEQGTSRKKREIVNEARELHELVLK